VDEFAVNPAGTSALLPRPAQLRRLRIEGGDDVSEEDEEGDDDLSEPGDGW